jgi:hypothetical protein
MRQIMKVEPKRNYCPHAINIKYTIQYNKMKRFMMSLDWLNTSKTVNTNEINVERNTSEGFR